MRVLSLDRFCESTDDSYWNYPVLVSVGPLTVRWYGLMYAVGIMVGLLVAWPYAKAKGITAAQMERVLWWAIPAGLVGARLYYVLQQPLPPYLEQPWRIMAFGKAAWLFTAPSSPLS